MTAPRVLALDLSLTATGVAFPDGGTATWSQPLSGVARLAWFRQELRCWLYGTTGYLHDRAADVVVLEDYAYSARGAHSHELGELGGVVRLALHDLGVPWVAVIPSSLKKYATGVGNAPKNEVLAAAIRRLGYDGHSDNEADALWLREMAVDHYSDAELAHVPKAHRSALDKIAWPELAL